MLFIMCQKFLSFEQIGFFLKLKKRPTNPIYFYKNSVSYIIITSLVLYIKIIEILYIVDLSVGFK